MPPRRGSLKRGYYSSSTCLRRFSDPPHTAKRDIFYLLGEHALLARLLARLPRPSPTVLVGPGDDAAVVAGSRNERLVVTTDAVVEGVHFSRAYSTPADIGHRALAVNLSDLAAMGATPRWALLSLVLPGSHRGKPTSKRSWMGWRRWRADTACRWSAATSRAPTAR